MERDAMGHLVSFVSRDCVFPNHIAVLVDILCINSNINVRTKTWELVTSERPSSLSQCSTKNVACMKITQAARLSQELR